MGKQAVSRNNSRYRSENGSIRDRAYEISVGLYKRTYLTVTVEGMKYLGLMRDWGETGYLSEGVRRSWAGEYVYLEGEVDCGKMEAKRQCAMANGVIVISRKEMDRLGEVFGE